MIANLPMYQRPELVDAHDLYWQLIRQKLAEVNMRSPEHLSQDADEMEVWGDPNLVLSQTCGLPYRTVLHPHVTLIGTADFGVNGCPPGYYRSGFIIRENEIRDDLRDFKNALFAYNDEISQSGYFAARFEAEPLGFFFERQICSGDHVNSAKMVSDGRADIAAIDAVSLTLMSQYEDFMENLKVLCWTKPTPGLPYITAKRGVKDLFFYAIKGAIRNLPNDVRKKLMIKDIIDIPKEDYLALGETE